MDEPQTIVVTGASAGVGRATAIAFAAQGARVALLARGEDGLDGAARDVERAGGQPLAIPTDVADFAQVEAAAALVEQELGPIDVWVNNAMTTVFAPVIEISAEEFKRATEVTYLGQVHGTLAALRYMRRRDRGVIVNVGSALAFRAIPLQAPYCASKFACRGFTEALRTELLHDGSRVRVSMVHLPAIDTPQFSWCRSKLPKHPQPVPPIYPPELAAERIVRAAHDGRRQDILGSWNWLIIQGNKLMPGVLDFYAARTSVAGQQLDRDVPPDRPDNLCAPVDGRGGGDFGAHGIFGDRTGGVLDPSFLTALPQTLGQLAASFRDRLLEVLQPGPQQQAPQPESTDGAAVNG